MIQRDGEPKKQLGSQQYWRSQRVMAKRLRRCVWHTEVEMCQVSFSSLIPFSSSLHPYASSSKPMPTLWPPALKFFPSIRAERVSFTPTERDTSLNTHKVQLLSYIEHRHHLFLSSNQLLVLIGKVCRYRQMQLVIWSKGQL